MMPATGLPPVVVQAERLGELGVLELAGLTVAEVRAEVRGVVSRDPVGEDPAGDRLLVIHPGRVPASVLAPLLRRGARPGFVVADMTDVDDFSPVDGITVPDSPVYLVRDPRRHDEMRNRSPDEALPAILGAGRTPLTLGEGLHWLLQRPEVLERGRCFMTAGSRLRRVNGSLDARTPAVWISNGTGRDGRERRDAPKVGWCWAGNRHTWLGFASAATRSGPAPRVGS